VITASQENEAEEVTETLVSIIMPAFNAERFIAKALGSIRQQTHTCWELFVTNDGGTDSTPQIVAEFAKSSIQRVELIKHQRALGPSAARNSGMKAAHGKFIAFLDSDDFWLPGHLENVCSILQSGKGDLAYSDCFVFKESQAGNIELLPIDTIEIKNSGRDLFRRNFINPSSAAISRRLLEKVGEFDTSMHGWEDADYWIRAAIAGFQICCTEERTCYYRKSEGSLSSRTAKLSEGVAAMFEKHRKCGLLPESEILTSASNSYYAAGKMYWRKDAVAARRNFYKSWTLNRRRALPLLWYLLTPILRMAKRA
jgi:glycosyltransferase involved in cell wall biosynthesis